MNITLALAIFEKAKEFLDKIGQTLMDYVFGWLQSLSPMMQALVLIGLSILSIIGIISLIKWSWKVVFPLAILAILGILLWVFVLK